MIVIKFGGHAMTDEHGAFAQAIAEAISSGVTPVVVHGGGPQIGEALKAAGIHQAVMKEAPVEKTTWTPLEKLRGESSCECEECECDPCECEKEWKSADET